MKIRISATRIKSWFQYHCERKFIYSGMDDKMKEAQEHHQLTEKEDSDWAIAGNTFEYNLVQKQLLDKGITVVHALGVNEEGHPKFIDVSQEDMLDFFTNPHTSDIYIAQAVLLDNDTFWFDVLGFTHAQKRLFSFHKGNPDLLYKTVQKVSDSKYKIQIHIIDIKATGTAMSFHKTQVAFYQLLLEGLIAEWKKKRLYDAHTIDISFANMSSIWHLGDTADAVETGAYTVTSFDNRIYRHMVLQFCKDEMLAMPSRRTDDKDDTRFHVYFKCEQCVFLPLCMQSLQYTDPKERDISAITGLSHQGKSVLRGLKIHTLQDIVTKLPNLDIKSLGSTSLQQKAQQYIVQAQSIMDNNIIMLPERKSLQMPPKIDCAIYLLVDRNPITNTLATCACRIVQDDKETLFRSHIIRNRMEEADAIQNIFTDIYVVLVAEEQRKDRIVHFFTYEPSEAEDIKNTLFRLINTVDTRQTIVQFAKMFPPDNIQPEVGYQGVSHIPGCSVQSVFRQVFVAPIQVYYDLARLSQVLHQSSPNIIHPYQPIENFQNPISSRLSIAICQEVDKNYSVGLASSITNDIYQRLCATESIVNWLCVQNRALPMEQQFLCLDKAPFQFFGKEFSFQHPQLDILHVQSELEDRLGLLGTLMQLAQPIQARVDQLLCIPNLKYVRKTDKDTYNYVVDFTADIEHAYTDIAVGDLNLLLTNGSAKILLHPETWPHNPESRAKRYYVSLEEYLVQDDHVAISFSIPKKQWDTVLSKIHEEVQRGESQWVLDKGYRDFTLFRLNPFFMALDARS